MGIYYKGKLVAEIEDTTYDTFPWYTGNVIRKDAFSEIAPFVPWWNWYQGFISDHFYPRIRTDRELAENPTAKDYHLEFEDTDTFYYKETSKVLLQQFQQTTTPKQLLKEISNPKLFLEERIPKSSSYTDNMGKGSHFYASDQDHMMLSMMLLLDEWDEQTKANPSLWQDESLVWNKVEQFLTLEVQCKLMDLETCAIFISGMNSSPMWTEWLEGKFDHQLFRQFIDEFLNPNHWKVYFSSGEEFGYIPYPPNTDFKTIAWR